MGQVLNPFGNSTLGKVGSALFNPIGLLAGNSSSNGAPNVPLPPPAAHPATMGDASLALAGIEARRSARAAEGEGEDNTIQTSPQGVMQPATKAPSTLLGG